MCAKLVKLILYIHMYKCMYVFSNGYILILFVFLLPFRFSDQAFLTRLKQNGQEQVYTMQMLINKHKY